MRTIHNFWRQAEGFGVSYDILPTLSLQEFNEVIRNKNLDFLKQFCLERVSQEWPDGFNVYGIGLSKELACLEFIPQHSTQAEFSVGFSFLTPP